MIFVPAHHATPVAATLYFFAYVPYNFLSRRLDTVELVPRLLVCLFSNSAMAFGVEIFVRRESMTEGVQWSNISESINSQLHLGHILVMLIADSVLYFLIAMYIEQVRPGDFGVPRIWYYPFTRRYWFGEEVQGDTENARQRDNSESRVGIEIIGLSKVYPKEKRAVSNLNLKIFENQITVLLGHNGAGKSTTMSMLTGMLRPTSGTALINGCNIRTNIRGVRASIGLCPQQNNLFDELTVREHILFYSCLKGLGICEAEQEVQKYATLLNITDKLHVKSQFLSGGMQRKLSVAVALCAGSKVVLFDEPTAGIDPAARRDLWNLLTHEKIGRTILLSTHSMDEADVLADSIAIMAGGRLKAVGTPFALKQQHGGTTRIVCIKALGCDIEQTTRKLQQHVPDLKLHSNTSGEFSYELRGQSFDILQAIMQDLENNMAALKILNFGVIPTSMRDIFMKIGSDSPSRHLKIQVANVADEPETTKVEGVKLVLLQVRALFWKYCLATMRNWRQMALQNLFPVVLVLLTVGLVRSYRGYNDLPTLDLKLGLYNPTITILQSEQFAEESSMFRIAEAYRDAFPANKWNQVLEIADKDLIPFVLDEVSLNTAFQSPRVPTANIQNFKI
jgi:ATP-binding cassette, subfamily A (ABC1), member 3